MKYVYSILIIVVGFFAIPAVIDFSGTVADHIRLVGKDADDATPSSYNTRIQQDEARAAAPVSKPTAVRYIKE